MKRKTTRTRKRTPTRRTAETARVERQLLALERKLSREVEEKLGDVRAMAAQSPTEFLDMAAMSEADYMSAMSVEAGSATLAEVHQALAKVRNGTYGVCDGCGKPIAKRRLKVQPFATLCLGCKEQQERYGYVRRTRGTATAALADGDVGLNLTDEDVHVGDMSSEDVLRDIENMEISEMY